MKKFLFGFLCICAFLAVVMCFTVNRQTFEKEVDNKPQSETSLLKKDLDFGDLDGGEDEGIYLLTAFLG